MGFFKSLFSALKPKARNIRDVDKMDGYEFEVFSGELLKDLGYKKVEVTSKSNDYGVDIICTKKGVKYAIQCKCYSSKLGNSPVQEAVAGKNYYKCDVGVVLTNNYFTENAINLAKANGILLWDRNELIKMIYKADIRSAYNKDNYEQKANTKNGEKTFYQTNKDNRHLDASEITGMPHKIKINGGDYDLDCIEDVKILPTEGAFPFTINSHMYTLREYLRTVAPLYREKGYAELADMLIQAAEGKRPVDLENALTDEAEEEDKYLRVDYDPNRPYAVDCDLIFNTLGADDNQQKAIQTLVLYPYDISTDLMKDKCGLSLSEAQKLIDDLIYYDFIFKLDEDEYTWDDKAYKENTTPVVPKTVLDVIGITAERRKHRIKEETKPENPKTVDDIVKRVSEENPIRKFNIVKEETKQSFDDYKIPNIDLFSYTHSNSQNTIRIYDLLDTIEFISNKFNACLGKDFDGNNVYHDLIKYPHLLISGETGTGKSICMHSIIVSLLFETKPDEVRLLLIDPKAIEFNKYNGIPQLLIPVVNDVTKASGALGWAVSEMQQRYNKLTDVGVRDIDGYNSYASDNKDAERMPHIVIFVDGLELLMYECKKDIEDAICRLSAMGRTVGMHLIISTQQEKIMKRANLNTVIETKITYDDNSLASYHLLYNPSGVNKPTRIKRCLVQD